MLEATVKVINPLGLHARAAAQVVRLSSGFKSKITITRADNSASADAKSMLSVLTLSASINTILDITVNGEDETAAFDAICDLFNGGFGEI